MQLMLHAAQDGFTIGAICHSPPLACLVWASASPVSVGVLALRCPIPRNSLSLSLSLSWTLFRDTSKPAGPSPPYPPLRVPLSPRWRRGRRPGPVALPGGGDQATRYYPLGLH